MPEKSKIGRWIKTAVADVLVVTALYFLVKYLVGNWYQIVPHLQDIRPGYVIAASVPTLLVLLLSSWGWTLIMRWLGVPLGGWLGFQLYYQSSIFRYLPGSLWYLPGRGILCQRQGISLSLFGKSAFLELFFLLAAAGMLGGIAVAVRYEWAWLSAASLATFLGMIAVVVFQKHFRRLVLWKSELDSAPRAGVVWIILTYIGAWCMYGASLNLLLVALGIPVQSVWDGLYVTSAGVAAWMIGFLSFVPTGLGIREASLVSLLQPIAPAYYVIVLGLVQRSLEILLEGGLWCVILAKRLLSPKSA
ncbi:MAG: flippase-like domain-containing protein [Anaerolineae bacterium]|nr:flippase-like domain-containing protein [Anaerolineae bacterium]